MGREGLPAFSTALLPRGHDPVINCFSSWPRRPSSPSALRVKAAAVPHQLSHQPSATSKPTSPVFPLGFFFFLPSPTSTVPETNGSFLQRHVSNNTFLLVASAAAKRSRAVDTQSQKSRRYAANVFQCSRDATAREGGCRETLWPLPSVNTGPLLRRAKGLAAVQKASASTVTMSQRRKTRILCLCAVLKVQPVNRLRRERVLPEVQPLS